MNLTFTEDRPFAIESPIEAVEGVTLTLACTFWGAVTSPSAAVYRNRAAVTSTVMPSGSHTASGSVATLKPLTALMGGANYIIAVTGTVAGDVHVKKVEVICSKDEAER